MSGGSWNFIGEVVIIGWIFKAFPRLSLLLILICFLFLFYNVGLDTLHVGSGIGFDNKMPTGVENGWDGMQYYYKDKRDNKWISESELYNIKTSENRIDYDSRKRAWQLSDEEKRGY